MTEQSRERAVTGSGPAGAESASPREAPAGGWFRILLLGLGAFAVGTDAYIVAGLLPDMSRGLHVSQSAAGQSVTAFAFWYVLLSPVLATVTARWPRHRLLVVGLAVLAVANLAVALAGGLAAVLVARSVAAAGAALYTPTAITVSASLVPESQRGRALSVVPGGLTVATVLGVPVGTLVDMELGWRVAIALVSVLAALVLVSLLLAVPAVAPEAAASLRARLAPLGRRSVLAALAVTVLGVGASYAVYTYASSLVREGLALPAQDVSLMLLLYGLGALGATLACGYAVDRFGPRGTLVGAFLVLILALGLLGVTTTGTVTLLRGLPIVAGVLVVLWGAGTWAQPTAQQYRLMALAPDAGRLVISLNASAIYVGIGLGAVLGGFVLGRYSAAALAPVGAAIAAAALLTLLVSSRGQARAGAR